MLGAGGAYVDWPQLKEAIVRQSLSVPASVKRKHTGAVTVGFWPGNTAENVLVMW
jgi:hypothetical protein